MQHFAILIDNQFDTNLLVNRLQEGYFQKEFSTIRNKQGAIFSIAELERFIDNEERHDIKVLSKGTQQSLKSMSSGERKKALLGYTLSNNPEYLILVNPYDNLDMDSQIELKEKLTAIAKEINLIQLISRLEDILPLTTYFFAYKEAKLLSYKNKTQFWENHKAVKKHFDSTIPRPIEPVNFSNAELVIFKGVSVVFNNKQVLKAIDWNINKGDFWQLIGPNGSGKSTLLNMITGDSHKGYGQNLTLWGNRKGSGESVWDIKKYIGYFTPSMTDKFKGHHTLENMLISGLHDSVGLYIKPSERERELAQKWLKVIGLNKKRNFYFHQLSTGEKRLLMVARAMIKHPSLLILDEPTAGLDDSNTSLFLALVNKIAKETESAIVYVSHRAEVGLHPQFIYELTMTENGSTGKIIYI